jgi:hypothetical protein
VAAIPLINDGRQKVRKQKGIGCLYEPFQKQREYTPGA